jgi:hypothetical protein
MFDSRRHLPGGDARPHSKEKIMFRALTFSAIATAALAAAAPALAQSGVQVGVLECTGGQSASYLVGSTAGLNCVFRPSAAKGGEGYTARVNRVGLDVGFTNSSAVTWLVFAPSKKIGKGGLAGTYGGVSANAAVGVGGGANLLVGGSNNSITLQPLSVQGQTGLNLAAGVTNVELRAAGKTMASKSSKKSSGKKKK